MRIYYARPGTARVARICTQVYIEYRTCPWGIVHGRARGGGRTRGRWEGKGRVAEVEKEGKGDRDWIMARGLNAGFKSIPYITLSGTFILLSAAASRPCSRDTLLFYFCLFLSFFPPPFSLSFSRYSSHMQLDMSCRAAYRIIYVNHERHILFVLHNGWLHR